MFEEGIIECSWDAVTNNWPESAYFHESTQIYPRFLQMNTDELSSKEQPLKLSL